MSHGSLSISRLIGNLILLISTFNISGRQLYNRWKMLGKWSPDYKKSRPVANQTAAGVCAIEGDSVYFSGWLNSVNGVLRRGFAVVNMTTGNLTY